MSYLILCLRLGYRLPGSITIPEQIARDKKLYYRALESADAASHANRLDLSELESYIAEMLAEQLVSVHKDAVGKPKKN